MMNMLLPERIHDAERPVGCLADRTLPLLKVRSGLPPLLVLIPLPFFCFCACATAFAFLLSSK